MSESASAATPKEAFAARDADASRAAHDARRAAATEDHGGAGSDFVKSLVFGGLDGVITTFSTIASVTGGSMGITTVLVLGFANLIADAIAMGAGDYLSSLAEFRFLQDEEARAGELVERREAAAAKGLADTLVGKGLERADAAEIVSIVARNRPFFREFVLVEQFEQEVPDDPLGPLKDGTVCFVSFLVFGSLPLWVYVITYAANYHSVGGTFGISIAACAVALFSLGVLQGQITRASRWRAGTYMTVNGMLAGAAAYLLSWGIERAIGSNGSC